MFRKLIIIPAAFLAMACGGNDSKVDDALNADLATAAQANPYTPLDSISAAERAGTAALASTAAPATRTVYRAPARRTTTRRSSSSQPVYSAPAPARQPTIVKHTKRDAAIGAVAGAAIGAATSRNKVKGAIIGGAAGAILGGVIGNNIDKETRY